MTLPGENKMKRSKPKKKNTMSKIKAHYTDYLKETLEVLHGDGLLLVSVDARGKPNTMAIGWGTIGVIWGKPIFIVLVRPSRYTHRFMEQADDFTVNVPPPELSDITAFCGRVSGRDHDKFKEKRLIAVPGKKVKSPIIEQCVIHYECKVVHKNSVLKNGLASSIIASYYPKGDLHTVYFGEIVSVYASRDARKRLKNNGT
jgi:flavin reductase (DIM6/NTAB) family NADH-FMN oxidoreductase RutF